MDVILKNSQVNDIRLIQAFTGLSSEGIRNISPQDVPFGHGNYFELKAIETL